MNKLIAALAFFITNQIIRAGVNCKNIFILKMNMKTINTMSHISLAIQNYRFFLKR